MALGAGAEVDAGRSAGVERCLPVQRHESGEPQIGRHRCTRFAKGERRRTDVVVVIEEFVGTEHDHMRLAACPIAIVQLGGPAPHARVVGRDGLDVVEKEHAPALARRLQHGRWIVGQLAACEFQLHRFIQCGGHVLPVVVDQTPEVDVEGARLLRVASV